MWFFVLLPLSLLQLVSRVWASDGTPPNRGINPTGEGRSSLSGARTNDIPDFVGFSYSRAAQNSPSPRFISFMQENLNINANFIPAYGSFKATQAGVYQLSFSFLSRENEAAIVSLRVNQRSIVSALSEQGGHNPVAQSIIHQLQPGDVVQLEIMQGKVYESIRPEFAYTTFSGWLVAPVDPQFRRRSFDQGPERCCCEVCGGSFDPRDPPYPPPTYQPPQVPPPVARPPYILTTKPPYLPGYSPPVFRPDPIPPLARYPDNCCDALIVGRGNPLSKSIQYEKFGVYDLQEVSPYDGRAIFKHCDRNEFVYFFQSPRGWSGWMVGPVVGTERGGLILESNEPCVEHGVSGHWKFFDGQAFQPDPNLSVECFHSEIGEGRTVNPNDFDHKHYHLHDHVHGPNGNHAPRSLPAYKIQSNADYTEATFVFPNNGSRTHSLGSVARPGFYSPHKVEQHIADNLGNLGDLATVVHAKLKVAPNEMREGVVVKRDTPQDTPNPTSREPRRQQPLD
eukprot:maker-scaffold2509_size14967-snap-gene-0.3 protein:Tk10384 transcript:maker-scaffold2509_size14967-snap-gene-0.3-mRNA-1 annotation:"complement c1q-like protein 3-like"